MKFFKQLYMILTLKCRESSLLLTRTELGELNWAEKIAMRMHILICRHCRMFKKQISVLNMIFKKFSSIDFCESEHLHGLSDEKKEQIKKQLSEK